MTTVTDTIYLPNGDPASGTIYITPNSRFTATGGEEVYQIPITVSIDSAGLFTVDLFPNDTATPSSTSYNVRYSLDLPPGTNLQTPQETWVVPTSGSPVDLSTVRTLPTPTPGVSGYITSLNGLTAVTQLFARVNDTNVTMTITSATSTHTFTMGWTGTLAASRGGTGLNTSASTGVPKITAGTWSANATAQDLTSWPAGVSNTEVGYLDGVTSAIQTQLDAKVGGAANLTTAGAVPYVSASGVLNQDSLSFSWDAANNRLGIGTAIPGVAVDVVDGQARFTTASGFAGGKGGVQTTANNSRGGIQFLDNSSSTKAEFVEDPTYGWRLSSTEDVALNFGVNSTTAGGFAATTRNLLLGGTTDGNYKVDIQKSGSSGTLRVYDQTAVTGESDIVIRMGPSQVGSGRTPFIIKRNDGISELSGIDNAGAFFTSNGTTRVFALGPSSNAQAANLGISWSNTPDDVDQTKDTGLARNAAGVVEVNNGTLGVYRDLKLRALDFADGGGANGLVQSMSGNDFSMFNANLGADISITTNGSGDGQIILSSAGGVVFVNSQTPASASAAGTAGTIAWDSSYVYVCVATNTWRRVAIASW
jgi:hypothetical protein